MALNFYLIKNNISSGSDDYMAVSRSTNTYSIEDVFDQMTREGSTITTAEALAVFEEITQTIADLVEEGYSIVTPLVNIRPSVSGVFDSSKDNFDPARHQVRITMSAGRRIQPIAPEIKAQKISPRKRLPVLTHYFDNESQLQNDKITPGAGARITGSLLKLDENDLNQGIFFINVEDKQETRVESNLLRNKPGELIFTNPALPSGTYRLEVRSMLHNTTVVRTGVLSHKLTVS